MTLAPPNPAVVIQRPQPRPVATTSPHIDYERAMDWRLTKREIQVLTGIAAGRTSRETASALFLSEDTIKTHVRRLFGKLLARDRAHAVQRAWELGILTRTAR